MDTYGLDIDLDTHEFTQSFLKDLPKYRGQGWKVIVISIIQDPEEIYISNYKVVCILARKIETDNPYR